MALFQTITSVILPKARFATLAKLELAVKSWETRRSGGPKTGEVSKQLYSVTGSVLPYPMKGHEVVV